MAIEKEQLERMYRTMRRIRVFETEVNRLYPETKMITLGS